MKVTLITIGDEILIGQIIDTNSAWIAQRLNELGFQVDEIYSISDKEEAIIRTLERASILSDLIIVTGGLGPTNDDITKNTLLKYFNDHLLRNDKVLEHIKKLFNSKGQKKINLLNEKQADLPSKCKILFNPIGTASGMWFEVDQKHFIFMPGVPDEMKAIMNHHILPKLQLKFNPGYFIYRTILTQGISESNLAIMIKNWETSLDSDIKLAYLPSESRVKLRLTAVGYKYEYLKDLLDVAINKLYKLIPQYIYGENQDSIENRIGTILSENNLTISTTESCTGGYVSHLITSVPGSSKYFIGGVLAYNEDVKINILGVSKTIIENYGVVSAEVVKEMALSVKRYMKTDYGISTSGILGPSGGTEFVPVGDVWVGIAGPMGVKAIKYKLGSDRISNIRKSAYNLLFDLLNDLELYY